MIFRLLEDRFAQQASAVKAADRRYMQLALTLGRRGLGQTWPNPSVGAVVVKDGVIVGRGWTASGGRPHAEPQALARAGEQARGATLYVTLEPCSHQGKSPPCADAIIAAGVRRVVSAMEDPNPEVKGQGHARLRAAGIEVSVGLGEDIARRDHVGHISRIILGRPFVTLKLALSADEKIGAAGRRPVAITGEKVRERVHLYRAESDAILVGVGTALADNPRLDCRLPGMADRSPVRVILDRNLRLPPSGHLARTARQRPLWIFGDRAAEPAAATLLEAEGAHIIHVPQSVDGVDLHGVVRELASRGITRLMVEGGARIAASLLKADLVDEAWIYRSDTVIGDDGVAPLDDMPLTTLTRSPHFRLLASETLGVDRLMIYGRN
jgi:diaminohydroxyphosphoribosylaminopyrimidine deaminase/5-amino-6-(5-phosphoribosylamino)uracil reductase